MQRVFMIGWDGATFDLIRPWVAQGKLPTMQRLMETGVHGPLRSTIPPWTFPAWTSFMTGKNPGKHGIYDFFRTRPGSYNLEFVHGGHRRAATFWRLLSDARRSVVSISLPCTFPPERVNGVMISGFDFPGEGPGSFVDARGMYPPELYQELNQRVGRHPIDAAVIKEINAGRLDLALERMLQTIRQKAATAKYLLQHRPWDCFMILFGESDGSGHQFWKYCDPMSPLFVAQPPGVEDAILRIYQELDRQAAELLALVPADATILMMSDHGFGGVSDWVVYPNRFLAAKGWLRLQGPSKAMRLLPPSAGGWLNKLKLWAVANFPAGVQRALYRFGGGLLGRVEARLRYGQIVWSDTRAYFDENPYFPVLRINLRGRQPKGIVEPGAEYEAARAQLIRELESWRHPETGAAIVEKAYRREEIYSGPCLGEAADIIPKWALHNGYSYAFKTSTKAAAGSPWIEHVDPRQPANLQFFTSKSGTHRDDGIFLAHGKDIRSGVVLQGARIIDLAPTILHLLQVPVPADMDGRVLLEIFTNGSGGQGEVRTSEAMAAGPGAEAPGDTYSAADESRVIERLTALGYME